MLSRTRLSMRRFRFLLATVVVALLATGCIRSDLTVAINDDGSGTYSAIVAFNPKAIGQLAQLGGQDTGGLGKDPCKQIRDSANGNQDKLPSGAKVENYSDGDFCGVKITAPFAAGQNPSDAISKALGGLDSAGQGFTGIGLDVFSIKKTGAGWQFEATPSGAGTGAGASSSAGDAALAKQFLQGASSVVRIKLPGRVVEADSNPDAIDGDGVLIWNLNLTGETRRLKAHTEPGTPIVNKTYTDAGKSLPSIKGAGTSSGSGDSGGSSALPVIIGLLVVVGAIVGFVLWRKSKAATTAPAMAGAAMTSGMAPPASTPGAPPMPGMAPVAGAMIGATVLAPPTVPVDDPGAAASAAPGQPQWDTARNAYILWDAGSSKWLQYDNAAGAWKPIE